MKFKYLLMPQEKYKQDSKVKIHSEYTTSFNMKIGLQVESKLHGWQQSQEADKNIGAKALW